MAMTQAIPPPRGHVWSAPLQCWVVPITSRSCRRPSPDHILCTQPRCWVLVEVPPPVPPLPTPSPPSLRPYQAAFTRDISQSLRLHRRVVGTMATGSGKGTVAAHMAATAAARGHRVYVLAHRKELIEDLSGRIGGHGVAHGLIAAGRSMDLSQRIQVASIDTIARRLHQLPAPTLIIQDEAHHLIEGNKWGRVIAAWPTAYLVGLTATPQRLSGEGLGEGHGGYFRDLVLGPTPQWLTDQGFLSRARVLAPPGADLSSIRNFDTPTGKTKAAEILKAGQAMGDPVGHYQREIAPIHNGTVLGFCINVPAASAMAELYRNAGIPAAALDGNTDPLERRQMIRDLGSGVLKALFSCEIVSEGTDIPSVAGVQLLRPTGSLSLYLQQVGRGLRRCDGKPYATVLDHVGNSNRHGLPTDDRSWTLEGKVGQKTGEQAASVRVCPACFSCMPSLRPVCSECGHQFVPERRELQTVDGELVELQQVERRREQADASTLEELIAIGTRRGMKSPLGWARHVLAARSLRSGKARVREVI
jgi:DNA repair protein RadD